MLDWLKRESREEEAKIRVFTETAGGLSPPWLKPPARGGPTIYGGSARPTNASGIIGPSLAGGLLWPENGSGG